MEISFSKKQGIFVFLFYVLCYMRQPDDDRRSKHVALVNIYVYYSLHNLMLSARLWHRNWLTLRSACVLTVSQVCLHSSTLGLRLQWEAYSNIPCFLTIYAAHETVIYHNPPIYSFPGDIKFWQFLNRTTLTDVKFLRKVRSKTYDHPQNLPTINGLKHWLFKFLIFKIVKPNY
jgi:hypothetical protein